MTGNTLGWVIVAFVLYLLMMIAIGALYAKGNNNSEDYFLGGRKLNGFVRDGIIGGCVGYERLAADGAAGSYLLNRCRR